MINNWVDDELHKILGYSDSATVAFIIAQAKKSTDNEDFIERLKGSFDEITNEVKIFASKLLDKVPRTGNSFFNLRDGGKDFYIRTFLSFCF